MPSPSHAAPARAPTNTAQPAHKLAAYLRSEARSQLDLNVVSLNLAFRMARDLPSPCCLGLCSLDSAASRSDGATLSEWVPLPLIAAALWLGGMSAGGAWLGWTA